MAETEQKAGLVPLNQAAQASQAAAAQDAQAIQMEHLQRRVANSYEKQLQAARRLARHTVRKRLEQGLEPDDPDASLKKQHFANAISQELFDSLLFYPGANPVVEEVREELAQSLGRKVEFTYPPGDTMRVAVRENGKLRSLNAEEQLQARAILKRITDLKIGQTLFDNHMGIKTRISAKA